MRKYLKWFNNAVRPYRGSLAVMMLCHVLLTVCSVGFVYVSKQLVDNAVAALQGSAADSSLWMWTGVIIVIVIARIGLNALKTYLQTNV